MNERAACRGSDVDFLAVDIISHTEAKAICYECPVIGWCDEEVTRARQGIYGSGVHGTWAARLYIEGNRADKVVSIGECPACGVGDGKPCVSKAGKNVGQPHLSRRNGLPKCQTCDHQFNPSDAGRTRYCSEECSTTGRRQTHARSNSRRAKLAATAKNCIECGALTGGTRCQRCSARRASRISFGREVA